MSVRGARLAAVFAHPDDESRIVGGTLALAASRGYEISLYCATRGEGGDPRLPSQEVAVLREGELRTACKVLGVDRLWLDGFPDGRLADLDPELVMERIVGFLRSTWPHVVITFGPDGRTRHPDHVVVGRLAEAAFEAAGDPSRYSDQLRAGLGPWQVTHLYHTAVATSVARRVGWRHPALPDDELLAVDVGAVLDRKRRAAVEAHASQWALSPFDLKHGWEPWSVEHFRRARSADSAETGDVLAELAQ